MENFTIHTVRIAATKTRGVRIKATCPRGVFMIATPPSMPSPASHVRAVRILCTRFMREGEAAFAKRGNAPWTASLSPSSLSLGSFVTGRIKGGFVHIFRRGEATPSTSHAENLRVKRIAIRFVREIEREVGVDGLRAIVAANEEAVPLVDGRACASHRHCDADAAMARAFLRETGRHIAPFDFREIIEPAWEFAQDAAFYHAILRPRP